MEAEKRYSQPAFRIKSTFLPTPFWWDKWCLTPLQAAPLGGEMRWCPLPIYWYVWRMGLSICQRSWWCFRFSGALSHSIPLLCRPWWRQWTTSCSHRLWMRGGTWMQANSSAQPPSYSTLWRTVPSCWLITCWRQTSSGKILTISVRDRSHKYREQPEGE